MIACCQCGGRSVATSLRPVVSSWPHSRDPITAVVPSQDPICPIPRFPLVPFPGSHWSHSLVPTGPIPGFPLVPFPGSHWSHSRDPIGPIPWFPLVPFPDHSHFRYMLLQQQMLVSSVLAGPEVLGQLPQAISESRSA